MDGAATMEPSATTFDKTMVNNPPCLSQKQYIYNIITRAGPPGLHQSKRACHASDCGNERNVDGWRCNNGTSREFIAVRIAAPVDAFHHVCRKPNHNARWAPRAASIQACLPCVRLWQRAQRGWMAYIVVYSGSLYTASSRLPHVTCRCLPSCLS